MLTLEQVRDALADRNLSEVARRCGVGYSIVWRIAKGKGGASYETVKALSDYLSGALRAA